MGSTSERRTPTQTSRSIVAYFAISEALIYYIANASITNVVSLSESNDKNHTSLLTAFAALALGALTSSTLGKFQSTLHRIAITAICCAVAIADSFSVVGLFPVWNEWILLSAWPLTTSTIAFLWIYPVTPLRFAFMSGACLSSCWLMFQISYIVGGYFHSPLLSEQSLRVGIISIRMIELSCIWNGAVLFFLLATRTFGSRFGTRTRGAFQGTFNGGTNEGGPPKVN
jgi:hypothetical protein